MEDPSLEVDIVSQLENHMVRTLEQLKAFHLTVGTLMVELAAIRRTTLVTEKARARYKLNLTQAMRQAKPLLEEAAKSFDDQINSVNDRAYSGECGFSEPAGPKLH